MLSSACGRHFREERQSGAGSRGGGSKCEIDVLEVVPLAGGAFSAQLVPQIAALLEKHGYSKSDLGAFASRRARDRLRGCAWVWLRLKLGGGTAKAYRRDLVLEAVARSGVARGRVLAMLDAGRGDVYAGDYELDLHGTNSGRDSHAQRTPAEQGRVRCREARLSRRFGGPA
jgi:hypothetical protein